MKRYKLFAVTLVICLLISGCSFAVSLPTETAPVSTGQAYCVVKNNIPDFTENELADVAFEQYAPLDRLGRCGAAMACLGTELMPNEERESIGHIKPSGWVQAQYDFIDGKNLYNRCHLIGFQLSGENDNERNLITGTRHMNVEGMLPFENMVADYIKETGNHVLYRVTPVFEDKNMLAKGVRIEAMSVEDNGAGIQFHIFAYNIQPGVVINYQTGESIAEKSDDGETYSDNEQLYILNIKSKKFHFPDCNQAKTIKKENYKEIRASRNELLDLEYVPAGCCNP